jgi:hypothetical protein
MKSVVGIRIYSLYYYSVCTLSKLANRIVIFSENVTNAI